MEKKFQVRFVVQHLIGVVLFLAINILLSQGSPWNTPDREFPHAMNILWTVSVLSISFAWLIFILNDDWEPFGYKDENFYEKYSLSIKTPKSIFGWGLFILVMWFGYKLSIKLIQIYNASVVYCKDYDKSVESKKGFYDKMWKTYLQKEKITNLNRETFLIVTKMIMENRKDGMNIAWKWVQENQQIPYGEFTSFYKDLSTFIESKRDEYYKMEMVTQDIVNSHNLLIDTFPNNLCNKILNRKPLVFTYGILSDSTKEVFKTGVENVK